ncbi:hypothetical protein JCM8097_002845 [Rhodosporidiobolus ruineniae]
MLARQTLRLAATAQRTQVASFSSAARLLSEGMPAGHSEDSFKKREQSQENAYVRDAEKEKLKALRKSIEASKAHLEELEKQHKSLESSINGAAK